MPIVYILTNESMPDIIKIGITDNLSRRLRELDNTRSLLHGEVHSLLVSREKGVCIHSPPLHPLSPELVLSAARTSALVAGLPLAASTSAAQEDPASYLPAAAASVSPSEAFDTHDRPNGPFPLRFPAGARVWGLQPLSDVAGAALPAALRARLAAARLA